MPVWRLIPFEMQHTVCEIDKIPMYSTGENCVYFYTDHAARDLARDLAHACSFISTLLSLCVSNVNHHCEFGLEKGKSMSTD